MFSGLAMCRYSERYLQAQVLFSFHWRETCVLFVPDAAGSKGTSEASPPESPGQAAVAEASPFSPSACLFARCQLTLGNRLSTCKDY